MRRIRILKYETPKAPEGAFFSAMERSALLSNPYHMTGRGYGVASFRNGAVFLFDEADLPLIRGHTWHLGVRGYPATHIHGRTVVLHKLLIPDADGEIDHINGDRLDNRRRNLRVCTHRQNSYNQKRRRTNTSGYIGVSRVRCSNRYEAYIHHNGRKHHLGLYRTPEAAARTRDVVARVLFGEYARLNCPKGGGRDA